VREGVEIGGGEQPGRQGATARARGDQPFPPPSCKSRAPTVPARLPRATTPAAELPRAQVEEQKIEVTLSSAPLSVSELSASFILASPSLPL
jgi:hypothetical protein